MLRKKFTLFAAVLLSLSCVSARAALLDFSFSFNNVLNGDSLIEGIIRGLTDNATSAASSVEVTSNTDGFGIGEYIGSPSFNSWTVEEGIITSFNFRSFGTNNTSPSVTSSSLFFDSAPDEVYTDLAFRAGLTNSPVVITIASSNATTDGIGLSFTPRNDSSEVTTPATLALFGLGLLGLGWSRRKAA